MSTFALILIFTLASGVLSLIGGMVLLGRPQLVRKFAVHFVSFAAGALLATAFLDLLPEALEMSPAEPEGLLALVLMGILAFFLIERIIFRFHSHAYETDNKHNHATPVLLLIGDGVHNFIDGVIIASAFLVDPALGIVTAVAVGAHEIPQEIADFSIMLHHGWSKAKVLWTNLAVSLTSVAGAVIAFFSRELIEPQLPAILAVTAGIFIYIATSDLLPEISPETSRDKTTHILVLLALGIAIVWLAGNLEIAHI